MLLLLAVLLAVQDDARRDLVVGRFGWMADLAGDCWSALYPDGTRDTQCYSTQYGYFLRGTIEIVAGQADDERPPYLGDSLFSWDADHSRIRVRFWSNRGTEGEMVGILEGGTIVFAAGTPDGESSRTVWTRTGPDGFRVVSRPASAVAGRTDSASTMPASAPSLTGRALSPSLARLEDDRAGEECGDGDQPILRLQVLQQVHRDLHVC
jgi:hypothetical protein